MIPAAPDTQTGAQPELRSALRCALPAMILAALLLLPFLKTPFTIDDPIYLREAQHVLQDPLHPQAFEMVWSLDLNRRVSSILPGGLAMPYLLVPDALLGFPEWAAHLTQLFFFGVAILAAALAALRLGMSSPQASTVALLTAASPAALGMAGTVMPDIPAMMFVILGVERLLAWREGILKEERPWHAAALASVWLTLATLTRLHTILILAPAFVLLLDGLTAKEIRASFKKYPARFLPLVIVPVAYFAISAMLADPEVADEGILATMLALPRGLALPVGNTLALLANWCLVIPFTIPWLILRRREIPGTLLWGALIVGSVAALRFGFVAIPAAATAAVLADAGWDAITRRDRVDFALWLWLWLALPIVIYIQLPSKYLLPSLPAAMMLLVRQAPRESKSQRWFISGWFIPAIAASAVLGLLILIGTRDLAEIQRRAVTDLVEPQLKRGAKVWFSGHWGFQWYAEQAGAMPVTLEDPLPQKGDVIVVSTIDLPQFPRRFTARKVIQRVTYPGDGIGRVMDIQARAGFFSNQWGYLPWIWGRGATNRYEVWEVE